MLKLPQLSLEDLCRFWQNVKKTETCWYWIGSQTGKSGVHYKPSFKIKGTNYVAYRISWLIHYKEDPVDKQVCHECDNPLCMNPEHLWLGTHSENQSDSHRKGRVTSSNRRMIQDHEVPLIRQLRDNGETLQAIADKLNVTKTTIHLICSGQRYAHV